MACVALIPPLAAACGGAGAATATELPSVPRRPDGVVLEPPPALPSPAERAPGRGIVALREPLAAEAVREVVRTYFAAFEREDVEALLGLLTAELTPLDARSRPTRSSLAEGWRTRMRALDFGKLAGMEVVQLERLEHFSSADLGEPGAPARPPGMRGGDVLVRVPVSAARVNGERFFGDVLVLLLRREEGHYKIAGLSEEDAP